MKCDVVALLLIAATAATAQLPVGVTQARRCPNLSVSSPVLDLHSMMSLVVGTRISSPFGLRTHPILGFLEFHKGMDIAAAAGSPIHVVTSGVIEGAGPKGSYGLWVKIRHSLDYETAYAHLSAFAEGIRPGVMVFAGDEIGKVGSTGMSTGPHLHLEWIYRGTPINPACPAPAQISLSQPFGKRLTGASSRQKNFTRTTTKSRQRRLYEKRK